MQEIMLNKQEIIKTVVIIWILGSVLYIGYDTWNDYKIRGMQQAYQAGIDDSTKQIFEKSRDGQCKQPVEISFQGKKLDLIDVECLKQQAPAAEQSQAAPAKK